MMKLPLLVTLPHGKSKLPSDVEREIQLSAEQIQEGYCDYGSDELFSSSLWHIVDAAYSRLFCDLNRSSTDWSYSEDLSRAGVVRERTESGQDMYQSPLTLEQKGERVSVHKEFYAKCLQVIENQNIKFFIAGHTMEDYPMSEEPTAENKRPDVVISTNKFQTCDEVTTYLLADSFREQGFSVQVDKPFLGGHLLTHICDKEKLPGVQIEVRRGLFSYGPHEVNANKLQDARSRIQNAILKFWPAFCSRKNS